MSELHAFPTAHPLRGAISVPADKSISHRAALLGALADGDVRVENFLQSETTRATLVCLRALGAGIDTPDASTVLIHGRGLHSLNEPAGILFCGGSGTTMRLLAGVCAGQDFFSVLDGTRALKRRPMARVAEPLRAMGAAILARDGGRLPPLAIRGASPLHGIDYTLPVASAQVKSSILFAGLFADSPTTLREPSLSRDHTERMLRACGVDCETQGANCQMQVRPPSRLTVPNSQFLVPGDFSSAAFFVIAALVVKGSEMRIERVGVNPTRTGLLDALARMGARISVENEGEESGEPVADLVVGAGRAGAELISTEIGGDEVPRMIDEFPIFAVAATQARGETTVRDAQELRVKESDRIATLAGELRKMGAQIEERADGFAIAGPTPLHGARVSAHNDHRLAMSLAVAGLIARGETIVEGWESVADSFPNFETVLGKIR
jgi:3-phosphoshikimate 1-carboxyvinyltransferase